MGLHVKPAQGKGEAGEQKLVRMSCRGLALWVACLGLLLSAGVAARAQGQTSKEAETHYLMFQVFIGAADPAIAIGGSGMNALGPMPSQPALDAYVKDIVTRIGSVGQGQTRLGVVFGLLAFDHTDAQVRGLIEAGFAIALKYNIAVGFHVDDSMFWARRKDLWSDADNVEWLDWDQTPSTGRRIDWGPTPEKIPPQMCFNSKAIQALVRARAAVIGKAIQTGRTRLRQQGKDALFAGIIAGSETQIGQDFDTGRSAGYHALANRGYSKTHPPADPDAERESVTQEFIGLWSRGLTDAGVPADRVYAHVAFQSRRLFDQNPTGGESYAQHNHFASPGVAFGSGWRPGFSTYPQPGLFEQIYAERDKRGRPAWASSEGTNLQLGSGPGQSGMNMETYLAKMFNHGAALVNIYSWGVGGEAHKDMDFRVVTEGANALAAYRKFLRGDALIETASASTSYLERLPAKIHRIQQELPACIQKTGGQARAQPLMQRLDAALKANDFVEAERVADLLLKLLSPPMKQP